MNKQERLNAHRTAIALDSINKTLEDIKEAISNLTPKPQLAELPNGDLEEITHRTPVHNIEIAGYYKEEKAAIEEEAAVLERTIARPYKEEKAAIEEEAAVLERTVARPYNAMYKIQ